MYDTIIIGTGTAGLTAAKLLTQNGKKVAIVDNRPFGGTCALRGCQPKKYFVNNTHTAAETRALLGKGYESSAVTNWPQLQAFKSEFTSKVTENTEKFIKDEGIVSYRGTAKFKDSKSIIVENGEKIISAKSFIIATGASPVILNMKGSVIPPGSDDFLELKELPKSIVFIGGGYISLEFAFVAALAGSKVTVLQKNDTFLPIFPQELLKPVIESAEEHGIQMLCGVDVTSIKETDGGYRVSTLKHGNFDTEYVLSGIGRTPEIKDLNLDAIGLKYDRRGIITDEYMQSSVEGIYAAGDCVSSKMLAPVADMEAITAAHNIIQHKSMQVNYDSIPSVVFTYPQMASVGLTSEEAREQGHKIIIKSGSGGQWMNYRRIQEKHIYYETITDVESGKILGAHVVSPHAGEIINLFALAINYGLPSSALKNLPWAYPTYTSDIKYMV
jgi:glutathione reductase (NADPH)